MPERLLQDRVAVITGAGGGIGRATAEQFAREGALTALLEKDPESGNAVEQAVRQNDGRGLFLRADVTDADAVRQVVERAVSEYGRVDILVNVVGVSGRRWGDGPVAECTEEAWDRLMAINLKSVFLMCRQVIPEMLKGAGGSIVNISSVLGLVGGDADFATHAYAATKGGIISLTRSIATYYASQNIRANVICPGLIATPMSERAQGDPGIRERLAELQPLTGDFGTPDDVAGAALYLASDLARFVTGAVLPVDGGWTAR